MIRKSLPLSFECQTAVTVDVTDFCVGRFVIWQKFPRNFGNIYCLNIRVKWCPKDRGSTFCETSGNFARVHDVTLSQKKVIWGLHWPLATCAAERELFWKYAGE